MTGRLKGKVAIITGGCAGMGLAGVELFVAEGAKVVVADIREDQGLELEQRLTGSVCFIRCDVRNEADWAATVALALDAFGGLDIMYHNAGAPVSYAKFDTITEAEWDDAQALLLRSTMFAVKHAVAPMRQRGGGSIILTSSVAHVNLRSNTSSAYVVAKAAVSALGRIAALDFSGDRIRINTIVPGGVPTSIHGSKFDSRTAVADRMATYFEEIFADYQPLPQMGRTTDIAKTALFLASDDSAFITGQDLAVDGGLSLERRMTQERYLARMAEAKEKALTDLGLEA